MNLNQTMQLDLIGIYKDAGVPVEYNGYQSFGVFLHEATEVLGMSSKQLAVQSTAPTLTIPAASLGTLTASKPSAPQYIMVEQTKYQIDKFILLGNGLEEKIWLSGTQS